MRYMGRARRAGTNGDAIVLGTFAIAMVDYSTDLPHGTAHPDPPGQQLRRVVFLGAELLRDNPVVEGPRQGNHAGYLQDGTLSPPPLPVPVSAGKEVVHRRPELASRLAERLEQV